MGGCGLAFAALAVIDFEQANESPCKGVLSWKLDFNQCSEAYCFADLGNKGPKACGVLCKENPLEHSVFQKKIFVS